MIIRRAFVFVLLLIMLISCRDKEENPKPAGGRILEPLTETAKTQGDSAKQDHIVEETVLPLVNPGENYSVLALYNGNLDMEPSDEQILLALPLDDEEAPITLMIATTNAAHNEYHIVWQQSLGTRTLTGINLKTDDLTGSGREDIVIVGFDANGRHVTEVFAAPENGQITAFAKVFGLIVNGNIDIVTVERSADYFGGLKGGTPYPIIVQQNAPSSENELDLIETKWNWSPRKSAYVQSESRLIKAETILEERIGKLYTGNASTYENYLAGTWYRESGERAFEDMLYFSPETREIMFYDGSILEIFTWGTSHRTTAKRLYFKINNSLIPSLDDTIYVSVDNWDSIKLTRSSKEWNSSYRRLNASLQSILEGQLSLKPLLSPQSFSGMWESHGQREIIFDLPRIEWITEDERRVGTASFFSIRDTTVLQVQFLRDDGSTEETVNWIAVYNQDKDNTRIIRSLTLSPAILDTSGPRAVGTEFLRFEQIEEVSSGN